MVAHAKFLICATIHFCAPASRYCLAVIDIPHRSRLRRVTAIASSGKPRGIRLQKVQKLTAFETGFVFS
jgi:hypothetical protein